jgi:hypothetical protein
MTGDRGVIEGLALLLTAASVIEKNAAGIKHCLRVALAELRQIDTVLCEIGFRTKRPELLDGEDDLDRCLALARDVAGRVRRAVAISMAIKSEGGTA